eukprot:1532371-Rhodomonas_salina.2
MGSEGEGGHTSRSFSLETCMGRVKKRQGGERMRTGQTGVEKQRTDSNAPEQKRRRKKREGGGG